ncbi:hypothetical protein [Streptomyces sp. NPDC014622]|uniref:hypothetical protein n=1 Tax=Streptomyces sp. NPDC014622 TaxID=3364874 RepID=UPI0036F82589
MTNIGSIDTFAYCSAACKAWCEAAVTVARAEYSPAIERRAHRLDVVATLLNLREHPGEFDGLTEGRRV